MLRIPDELKEKDGLLLFVRTPDASYAVEVSAGCGDQWTDSDKEDFPDCDEYINWDAARLVGAAFSGSLFEEADGGMYMYSSGECSDWQDLIEEVVLREVLDRDLKADNSDIEVTILGGVS